VKAQAADHADHSAPSMVALLGRRDEPTDGVRDYCSLLAEALRRRGVTLKLAESFWEQDGWLRELWNLWKQSRKWRGEWVLMQYTALAWSRRGFPFGFLAVLALLKARGARTATVFHEVRDDRADRLLDRFRIAFQYGVMRTAFRLADRSLLTVPVEQVPWLNPLQTKATFIPVGANISEAGSSTKSNGRRPRAPRTLAVFGVTGGAGIAPECADIGYVVKHASNRVGPLRLVVLGRGSEEAEPILRREFDGTLVEVSVLGLQPAKDIERTLSEADVLLFVRGHISTRRSSAIAAIPCGLPIVGYRGPETGGPITEAGVELVVQGDRDALAEALGRVLTEEDLWRQLHQRNLRAYAEHFSWEAVAERYIQTLASDCPQIALSTDPLPAHAVPSAEPKP
jgi:Glycosyl transferases group 1